ncbi:MAG TPA: cell division topological specificity factor MinE [Phormidium sp.]
MLNEFLEKIFPWTNNTSSRDDVKRRLKLVLGHDRTGLSPQELEEMRKEIIEVISRYVELETEELVFSIENNERSSALIANLPIRRIKKEEEEEKLEKENKVEIKETQETEKTPEIEKTPETE